MKLSPKQKEFESLANGKPNRSQYHNTPVELKNEGSPWKSVAMGYDPATSPATSQMWLVRRACPWTWANEGIVVSPPSPTFAFSKEI